jgi:hypothetical protein
MKNQFLKYPWVIRLSHVCCPRFPLIHHLFGKCVLRRWYNLSRIPRLKTVAIPLSRGIPTARSIRQNFFFTYERSFLLPLFFSQLTEQRGKLGLDDAHVRSEGQGVGCQGPYSSTPHDFVVWLCSLCVRLFISVAFAAAGGGQIHRVIHKMRAVPRDIRR